MKYAKISSSTHLLKNIIQSNGYMHVAIYIYFVCLFLFSHSYIFCLFLFGHSYIFCLFYHQECIFSINPVNTNALLFLNTLKYRNFRLFVFLPQFFYCPRGIRFCPSGAKTDRSFFAPSKSLITPLGQKLTEALYTLSTKNYSIFENFQYGARRAMYQHNLWHIAGFLIIISVGAGQMLLKTIFFCPK